MHRDPSPFRDTHQTNPSDSHGVLRHEQAEHGAESMTPVRRRTLEARAEEIRRLFADVELRQRDEGKRGASSAPKFPASLSRESPAIFEKVAMEDAALKRLSGMYFQREMQKLAKQLTAIETELVAGVGHDPETPHGIEEDVRATSKDLLPDVRWESPSQSEGIDNELPN